LNYTRFHKFYCDNLQHKTSYLDDTKLPIFFS